MASEDFDVELFFDLVKEKAAVWLWLANVDILRSKHVPLRQCGARINISRNVTGPN